MLEPALRLFHISDLHFVAGGSNQALQRSGLKKTLESYYGSPIADWVLKGVAGHDQGALRVLKSSIVKVATDPTESGWSDKSWLVMTGDLSTWGDATSVQDAVRFVDNVASAAGLPQPAIVYGNHDVWPGVPGRGSGFPFAQHNRTLDVHRTRLRQNRFQQPWVQQHPCGQVPVLSLNTVLHGRFENSVAIGEVQNDLYWQPHRLTPPQPHQLHQLTQHLSQCHVAVVLTHHPVFDPKAWPLGTGTWARALSLRPPPLANVLKNAKPVAQALQASPPDQDAVRLVLSGHTHEQYPEIGLLPPATPAPPHGDLGKNCVQLTTGTATQAPVPNIATEQTWQMISVWVDDSARQVTIERVVFSRSNSSGNFEPVCDPSDPLSTAERMDLFY